MEQILQHIADEQEIKHFHGWISELCHPDSPVPNAQHFDKIANDHRALNTVSLGGGKDLSSTHQEHSGQRILRALANKFVSIPMVSKDNMLFKCFVYFRIAIVIH